MTDIFTPLVPFAALPWLAMSPLEIVATLFGLWSVWAYTRESMWAWPSGLINVILFTILFWDSKLYGETGLQIVFTVLQFYGWWCWWRGTGQGAALPITRTSARLWTVLTAIAVATIVPLGLFLQHWTTSTTPWWDAIPTILSLVAQWMISKKKLENWYVWIVVDIFSIPLFAYKGLYLVAILYAVFLGLCIIGVMNWRAKLQRTADRPFRRGMILGKFMPPTEGHRYLAGFAARLCDRLSVLVCSKPDQPIPGHCRAAWMRDMLPHCDVVHVPDDLPDAPEDHPAFWDLWLPVIRRAVPEPIEVVCSSEGYGPELARRVGAVHFPADPGRLGVPVSGTAMRADPYANWQHLPAAVRPWYCRRVVVFGPESTGKSTLAERLARHYGTVWVPEYARGYLDPQGGKCVQADISAIALGQAASEDELARQANRVLICDTDTITTTIWSEVYFGGVEEWIRAMACERRHDLYLLCDIDVPWIDDRQRDMPHRREEFRDRCRAALEAHGRPYVWIRGGWEERFRTAVAAIDLLLGPLATAPPIAAQERLARTLATGAAP